MVASIGAVANINHVSDWVIKFYMRDAGVVNIAEDYDFSKTDWCSWRICWNNDKISYENIGWSIVIAVERICKSTY